MASRYDSEEVIGLLQRTYPAAFFETPQLRRPLKAGIYEDLIADGFQAERDLLRGALDWYQSHYGYQYALRAGARRIDLHGNEVGTVTVGEQATAQREIARIKEMRKVSHNPAPAIPAPAGAAVTPPASVARLSLPQPADDMAAALTLIARAKSSFGRALTEAAADMRRRYFSPAATGLFGSIAEDIERTLSAMEVLGDAPDPPVDQTADEAA